MSVLGSFSFLSINETLPALRFLLIVDVIYFFPAALIRSNVSPHKELCSGLFFLWLLDHLAFLDIFGIAQNGAIFFLFVADSSFLILLVQDCLGPLQEMGLPCMFKNLFK